jgi:4-hydroxy-tetrahydrodipicolinate synthase
MLDAQTQGRSMNFDGIWTPIATPFGTDGSVDVAALEPLLENLVRHAVSGIIVGGTTGEYYAQSNAERKQLLDVVAKLNRGRLPLMAGINATSTDETLDLGRYAKDAGYNCILLAAPYYCQPTQQELLAHALAVDDALNLPAMLYNFPARTGTEMGFDFIHALRSRPNFQSIKESTGSVERMHRLITEHADQLQVSCGMDDQVLEFFAWGARSWTAGASNFAPQQHVALYKTCVVEQDMVAGRALAARFLPMLNLLEQGGKFCQYVKYGCELAGTPVGVTRRPLLPLTPDEKTQFQRVYEQLVQA